MDSIQRKIVEAEDIADVIALMVNLNIETKGCKNIEQMQERICQHLNAREHLDPNKAFKVISHAQAMDKQKSLTLLKYYDNVEKVISKLDGTFLNLLKTSEGDVLSNIKKKMERIENREYVVLVAGETSAGKSSMLNLILGEELLPFSVLSTTSTICELKYGRERRIKVHFREEGKYPETKYLDESSSYMDQISQFVHVKSAGLRERAPQYKKVELFWPHGLLKEGVVIVDSPGIGESEIMDDIVVSYLPNAFAFIYVINSSLAGGVQKDRLLRLLHKTRELTTEQQMEFSPDCALFVCNKWDNIPASEASEVIKHITDKLRQCLPALDPDLQVMRLSTAKALMVQKYNIMNAEFSLLTENIGRLVKKSIENRLVQQWSWLDRLLDRIIWMMKSFVENAHTDSVAAKQRLNILIERLRKLQAEQETSKQRLRQHLSKKIIEAIGALIGYLKLPEVIKRFGTWNSDELPEVQGSWEVIEADIMKLVHKRLQTVIQEWEGEEQKFAEARSSVVSFFLREYNYLERELRGLEVSVSKGHTAPTNKKEGSESLEDLLFDWTNLSLTLEEKIMFGIAAPFMVPAALVGLGLAIPVSLLLLPVVGLKAVIDQIKERSKKNAYGKNRPDFVRNISEKYLEKVSTQEALQPLVEDQLKQVLACLNDLEMRIPMLVEADVQLCQQLMNEEQSKKDTEAMYRPRKEKCEWLRGEIGLFGALEIRSMQIAWDDLHWDVSEEVFLQNVLPPGIYPGKIKGRHASRQVNLKVYKELLTNSNVTECLSEDTTLRKLRHPHIVEYFGTTYRSVPRGIEAVFVTERPGETLKSYLVNHPGNNPADNSMSVLNVIRWAQQIVNALIFVHCMFQGCVHGDLRLENVLLDSSNLLNVKLSNICLTRRLTIEDGSNCDGFLHLPPEAIRNMTYNTSSEIYSLGIMLWQMWYGKEAFAELKGRSLEVFLVNVEEGHRPVLARLNTQTACKWSELIGGCWRKEAAERKALRDCASMIEAILSP